MDDSWDYFDAMSGAEFLPPDLPNAPMSFQACGSSFLKPTADLAYGDLCPEPWLEISAPLDLNTVQLTCSKAYFDWAQRYVRAAILHKPPSSASAKARVLWVLDVGTVVTLGLIATNIPLRGGDPSMRHPLFNAWGADYLGSGIWAPPGTPAASLGSYRNMGGDLELMRSSLYAKFSSGSSNYRALGEIKSSPLAPVPFMDFPLEWIGTLGQRQSQAPDPLYQKIYGALTLRGGWSQFAALPYRYQNALLAAMLVKDLPLAKGSTQWALWCIRDGQAPTWTNAKLNPLNMGKQNDQPSLEAYIASVGYESQEDELVYNSGSGALWPNFSVAYSYYASRILNPFLSLRFDKVIQAHVTSWLQQSVPVLDTDGKPLLNENGDPIQLPMTFEDTQAVFAQDEKSAQTRAMNAVNNPGSFCSKSSGLGGSGVDVNVPALPSQGVFVASIAATAAGQRNVLVAAQSIPKTIHIPGCSEITKASGSLAHNLGPVSFVASWLMSGILKLGGAALGNVWLPHVIRQPFVRSFSPVGFRTVPDGSTADVLPRVLVAITNMSGALGVNLCAECPAVAGPATTPFTPAASAGGSATALQQQIVTASKSAFEKLAQDPAYRRSTAQNSYYGRFVYNFVHAGDPIPPPGSGPMTQEELFAARARERAQPASFAGRLFKSFVRAGNPLRS